MAFKNRKNLAISELASGMDDSQLTATVKAGEGAEFPSTNFWFVAESEIMLCSSRTDDVLTVTRGQQSTIAAAHVAATRCYNPATIADIEELEAAFPVGAGDENVVVFDGVTGEKIKDSGSTKANLEDAIAKKHTSGGEAQGGDISGTVGNATVNKLKGKTVDEGAIADDKILVYKTATSTYVFEAKPSGAVAYAQYKTVAKSGGDYTTISAALTAITDAAADKRYCILVYPGLYDETVTCKSWVDIIGLSRHACRVTKSDAVTMVGAANVTIMNLSVINTETAASSAYSCLYAIAVTFVMRNCYIEKIATISGGNLAAIYKSFVDLKLCLYNCEVYCENLAAEEAQGIRFLTEGTIDNCKVTAKGDGAAGHPVIAVYYNGSGVIKRSYFECIVSSSHKDNFAFRIKNGTIKAYDCDFISNSTNSAYFAATGSVLKSCYLNAGAYLTGANTFLYIYNTTIKGTLLGVTGFDMRVYSYCSHYDATTFCTAYPQTKAHTIVNVAAGHITATDVQAAINELASLHTGNRGLIYVSTSGTMTITTGGTFEKIIGGTIAYTAAELSNFTHAAGVLTYTGTPTLIFIVTCFISVESGEIAQEIHVRLAKNGADIAGSCMQRDFTAQNRHSVVGFTWILSLATNDTVEAQITSDSDGDDIIINHLSFVVRGQ